MARMFRRNWHLLVFLGPALVIYLLFAVVPIFDSVRLSFFTAGAAGTEFVGLDNFRYLLTDAFAAPRFWNAFRNNVYFFLIHLLVQNPIGLLVAALLTSDAVRRTVGLYRTLIFIPTTLSVVIVGFIWQLTLSPLWGFIETPCSGCQARRCPRCR